MTVSFNTIPNTVRVPLAYVEFDNSQAITGTPVKNNKTLVLGLRLPTGSVAAGQPVRITRSEQAVTAFGRGSMLSEMLCAFLRANPYSDLYALALDDVADPVCSTGKITVTGTCSAAGQIALLVAGVRVPVTARANDTSATIANKIATAVNANAALPVTASVSGSEVTLTCRWGGITGNDVDVRVNYFTGETVPAGIAVDVSGMAGGVGNPDVSQAIAALGDTWWTDIVNPFTDTNNLNLLSEELQSRWGGIRQIDGLCWIAYRGTHAQASTFALSRNDYLFTCIPTNISPEPPYIWASVNAAVCTYALNIDPARPVQTLELTGIKPPAVADRWQWNERNLHLFDGLSAYNVNANGAVQLDRVITMYRVNKYNVEDPSYLDVETIKTLSYIRYAIRARITQRFPRHKLADDGTRFGVGQAMVTPSVIRAELIALFTELESAGLVENFDAYKSSLIVERDANDRNRINVLSNDDLVNQFRIYAHSIQFLL
ncbi:phage tail sheath C-terminal domain-containing protein [Gilliamella sp. CG16]|uniref:phage tail sheath C-terminal domain-containing protein n=1 Tax=Gilliamella sp. CG16 TaxID=3351503 RepID=UPI003987C1E0